MGNIKKRTPNTWIHELTQQTPVLRLGYLWVHLARTNPSSSNSGPSAQFNRKVARRCFARTPVNSLENIQHNSRWTYLSDILIFGLDSTVSVFSRLLPFSGSKNDKYPFQAFGRWSDTATRLGPTETWLASNKTSAILDCQSAGIVLVFLNVFSKRCCEGLYHWWQRELC